MFLCMSPNYGFIYCSSLSVQPVGYTLIPEPKVCITRGSLCVVVQATWVQYPKYRLWRKNVQSLEGTDCAGVDLNRNFDSHWDQVS